MEQAQTHTAYSFEPPTAKRPRTQAAAQRRAKRRAKPENPYRKPRKQDSTD
jgi:ribosomal protein S21